MHQYRLGHWILEFDKFTSLLCFLLITSLISLPIFYTSNIQSDRINPILSLPQQENTLKPVENSLPIYLFVKTHHQPLCTFEITNSEDQTKLVELLEAHPNTMIPTEFILGQSFTIYYNTEDFESNYTFNSQRLVLSIKNKSNSQVNKISYKIDSLYYDEVNNLIKEEIKNTSKKPLKINSEAFLFPYYIFSILPNTHSNSPTQRHRLTHLHLRHEWHCFRSTCT